MEQNIFIKKAIEKGYLKENMIDYLLQVEKKSVEKVDLVELLRTHRFMSLREIREVEAALLDKNQTQEKSEIDKWRKECSTIFTEEQLADAESGFTYKGKNHSQGKKAISSLPIVTFSGTISDLKTLGVPKDEVSKKNLDTISDLKTLDTISDLKTLDTISESDTISDLKTLGAQSKDNALKSALTPTSYEIFEEIARGGMGIVSRGCQNSLNREIAIKTLLDKTTVNQERFVSEALVSAYLDHPNIVPIYELGQNETEEVTLAMKLVRGTSWKDLLHPKTQEEKLKAQKYNLETHLGILLNVCNAIAFAHSKKIAHCDLKPENIMVGSFGEVLVMDWGVAVDFGENQDSCRALHKSAVKSSMGTPSYMSPELAAGVGEDIGAWTDVYLLGAILCEILRGKPPHLGENLYMVLLSAYEGKIPQFDVAVPRELREICYRALSKEIKHRYQNVYQFKNAIEEFLQHRESIVISDQAESILAECLQKVECNKGVQVQEGQRNLLYSEFAEAIAGFRQALKLWENNIAATTGEYRACLSYAKIALKNGDIGLAEAQVSQIKEQGPGVFSLQKKIFHAKEQDIQAKKTAKRLKYALVFAGVFLVLGLAVLLNLEKQKNKEIEEKNKAISNLKIARKEKEKTITTLKNVQQLLGQEKEARDRVLSKIDKAQQRIKKMKEEKKEAIKTLELKEIDIKAEQKEYEILQIKVEQSKKEIKRIANLRGKERESHLKTNKMQRERLKRMSQNVSILRSEKDKLNLELLVWQRRYKELQKKQSVSEQDNNKENGWQKTKIEKLEKLLQKRDNEIKNLKEKLKNIDQSKISARTNRRENFAKKYNMRFEKGTLYLPSGKKIIKVKKFVVVEGMVAYLKSGGISNRVVVAREIKNWKAENLSYHVDDIKVFKDEIYYLKKGKWKRVLVIEEFKDF